MARECASIDIVAAARSEADDHPHGLAPVKGRRILCRGGSGQEEANGKMDEELHHGTLRENRFVIAYRCQPNTSAI